MRRFRRRAGADSAGLELSSMIDMVFILLIFFIVTTSFVREAGVEVRRPRSARAAAVRGGFLPVAVTREGAVYVAGRAVAPDDVAAMSRALRETRTDHVVLQADRLAPVGLALQVQDTCLSAGANRVDVAATAQ